VHRDLKPSNVLLADDGPRVIDFGISHAIEASVITQSGAIVGSPGYMSPEQAQGHSVGPASDVFSLGALLAYAATGAAPFGEGPATALVYRVVNAEPDLDRVPAEFRPLIERCLAKVPGERPGLGDLLSELGGEPIQENWLPMTVTSTFPRYAAAARIAAMPEPEPPGAEARAAETAAPGKSAPETPGPETPAGGGIAPPARRRRQVKRWQQGAVIAVAVIAAVAGVASWLALGVGGSHPPGDPAAALSTGSVGSAGAPAAAKGGGHAGNPGQHDSHASSAASGKPMRPPSPAATPTSGPASTPTPSPAPTPTSPASTLPPRPTTAPPTPTPTTIPTVSVSSIPGVTDDPDEITASGVSDSDSGFCTAWLDNDGSGALSGMLNTSFFASCDAELYRSGGPAVSLSASWGAERTSALSDTGHTMWICVWASSDPASEQCSPPFGMTGDTPAQQ